MKASACALMLAACVWPGCFSRTVAEDQLPGPLQDAGVFAMENGEDLLVKVSVLVDGSVSNVIPWFNDPEKVVLWLSEEARIVSGEGGSFSWPSYGEELRGVVTEQGLDRWQTVECAMEPYAGLGETTLRVSADNEAPGYTRVSIEQWPFHGGAENEALAQEHVSAWSRALTTLRAAVQRGLPTTPSPPPIWKP